MPDTTKDLVKELCEISSKHTRLANLYWLGLMICSISSLITKPEKKIPGAEPVYTFPFSLGATNAPQFYMTMSILTGLFIIVFCIALIQVIKCQVIIKYVVDKKATVIELKDYKNILIESSYNRFGQILKYGKGEKNLFERKDYFTDNNINKGEWKKRFINLLVMSVQLLVPTFINVYYIIRTAEQYSGGRIIMSEIVLSIFVNLFAFLTVVIMIKESFIKLLKAFAGVSKAGK